MRTFDTETAETSLSLPAAARRKGTKETLKRPLAVVSQTRVAICESDDEVVWVDINRRGSNSIDIPR
jgi:hypothetical protein